MDYTDSNTVEAARKRGKHLTLDERGQIQALKRQGFSLRAIAEAVGCSHTTVHYELKRGTPERKGHRGRKPIYMAKRGQAAYEEHRKRSRRPFKIDSDDCEPFIQWMATQIREHRWSIDACVGDARRNRLFPSAAIPCTRTLYSMLWKGKLPVSLFDVPFALKRRERRKPWVRKNKRILGRSIEERPDIVDQREEFGHWEIDTVVGHRSGKGSVVLSLVEKVSREYRAIKIPGRDCKSVGMGMDQLMEEFGEHFSDVFKSITADNGPEFAALSEYETGSTKIYYTHPYSSYERAQNERHNGLLRRFLPKGQSIDNYTSDEVRQMAHELNNLPRRILDYHTPAEIFKTCLAEAYSIENIS